MPSPNTGTKFFVPNFSPSQFEAAYRGMIELVKDQMRVDITDKRIYEIRYVHDKKHLRARVGEPAPQQERFEVLAIFESKPYVMFTRARNGGQGVTILIGHDEITDVEEFAA